MAVEMISKMVDIKTKDGICDTYVVHPHGHKEHPIVLLYMDAVGLRKRMFDMADHIAKDGYFVVMPNLFYRSKRAPVVDYETYLKPDRLPELFQQVMSMASLLNPELSKRDTQSFLEFARKQPEANPIKAGAVGYCMGGGQALRSAGNFPNDFQAVASFHAGGLATDLETSPHRWFPHVQAAVYIGHADHDQHMPPEQMKRVEEALKAAELKYHVELYKDCRHGWTMADLPAYNAEGEKKHWNVLLDFFKKNLKDL